MKTVTNLTSESVSILTVTDGKNHRRAYENSESGRADLIAFEPDEVVNEVMAVWGDTPTVETPVIEPTEPEPTAEERLAKLEEQNNMLMECILEMSEVVYGG